MEAVGGAAAIAELSVLSLKAGKAAKSLVQSMNVNCGAQAEGPLGLRDRLRWATLDKKKAQRFLEEVRQAELDLNTMLHILEL